MHNPKPVLENETHKLVWDFEIQTDRLIPARLPNLIIIDMKKENLPNCGFCCRGLVWFGFFFCLMAYQLFLGYLMPKPFF